MIAERFNVGPRDRAIPKERREKHLEGSELSMILTRYFIQCSLVIVIFSITSYGETPPKIPCVDLDGDGFNNKIADNDDNGIPDRFESKSAQALSEMGSILGNVFDAEISLDNLRSTIEKFDMRKFRTRGLSQRCRGFGMKDDFGPGHGIGLGALGRGGGCAGGVCAP